MKPLKIYLFAVLLSTLSCTKTNVNKCCDNTPSVTSVDSAILAVPDVFTPNGDGLNDLFMAAQSNVTSFSLTINKNGKELFSTTDKYTGWDGTYKGKKSADGLYNYTVSATSNIYRSTRNSFRNFRCTPC